MPNIKLLSTEPIATDTQAFHWERPDGFEFKAGNSLDLKLIDPPETDDEGTSRTFSIASAPHEAELVTATRLRDSAFKRILRAMTPSTEVELEGPWNSPVLHSKSERPAVFLIGGIGITPIRSILRDAEHRELPHHRILIYANHTRADAPWFEEFVEMAERLDNFTFVPTFTGDQLGPDEAGYATGRISEELLTQHVPADTSPVYYLTGPGGMVKAMQQLLTARHVDDDDVRIEEFPGY